MRNAVIRKKVLKEQALFRKYMFTPQRLIVPGISMRTDENWSIPQHRFYNIY